jgi:hypothetical protein
MSAVRFRWLDMSHDIYGFVDDKIARVLMARDHFVSLPPRIFFSTLCNWFQLVAIIHFATQSNIDKSLWGHDGCKGQSTQF